MIIEFLTEYWGVAIALISMGLVAGMSIIHFTHLTTEEQVNKVKEWLVYAVALAERTMGEKTGQLKLRYVYEKFLTTFPWLSKVVDFDQFSEWVDESLETFKNMLESNEAVQKMVSKTK